MKKKDLETLEKRLLEERQKRVTEIKHLDETVLNQSLKDSSGDLKNFSAFHAAAPRYAALMGSGHLFYPALELDTGAERTVAIGEALDRPEQVFEGLTARSSG